MKTCKWIIRETGLRCGEPATEPVYTQEYNGYDEEEFKRSGKIIKKHHLPKLIEYLCPKHAKEFDFLRVKADSMVYHKYLDSGN